MNFRWDTRFECVYDAAKFRTKETVVCNRFIQKLKRSYQQNVIHLGSMLSVIVTIFLFLVRLLVGLVVSLVSSCCFDFRTRHTLEWRENNKMAIFFLCSQPQIPLILRFTPHVSHMDNNIDKSLGDYFCLAIIECNSQKTVIIDWITWKSWIFITLIAWWILWITLPIFRRILQLFCKQWLAFSMLLRQIESITYHVRVLHSIAFDL